MRVTGVEPKSGEQGSSCCTKRRKFCAFTRLGYGVDCRSISMPKPPFRLWLPAVAAASPEPTPGDAEPAPEQRGFFDDFLRSHDDIKGDAISKSMFSPVPGETGWDRLKIMYSKDQFGNLGPEWQHVIQGFYLSAFVGGAIGFFIGGRTAADKFVARNEGTKFLSEMAARKALQDKMTLGMASHAWKWSWRTATFTTIYLFTAANLSVYRGSSSILDYMVAGGVTGVVWKFLQGPRAMLVAGTLCSVLGLLAGTLSLTVLRLGGMTMEEMRYWHYQANLVRQGEVLGKVLPTSSEAKPSESANEASVGATEKTPL